MGGRHQRCLRRASLTHNLTRVEENWVHAKKKTYGYQERDEVKRQIFREQLATYEEEVFGKRLTNFSPNWAHVLEYLYLSILGNSKEFAIFQLPNIAPPDVIPSCRYKQRLNSQTL